MKRFSGAAVASPLPAASPVSGAYRAVWRWHFYAGLLTLPVLCVMALTGALYLFKPELEGLVYRDVLTVQPHGPAVSADRWADAAEAGLGGTATAVLVPAARDQAARISVRIGDRERTAFVDPYSGALLGSVEGEGLMGVVKQVHSLTLLGKPFNILVEIVAGWAVILVATGIFLWWPRPRDAGVLAIKARDTRGRPFWRDLHAVTGLYAGAVIAFLAVTGMPWSAVWGDAALRMMREAGYGRPSAPGPEALEHAQHHEAPKHTAWALQGLTAPGQGDPGEAVQRAVSAADGAGLPRPFTVSIPSGPGQAITVSRETVRAEEARSLYVDPASGRVVVDVGWSSFGSGSKAFEWGIAVHQGQQYGWLNRIVMLSGCVAIWLLAASAMVMWWKRRPKGRLGAPSAPPGPRVRAAVLGIVLPLAVLYPLTGLSLVFCVLIDQLARRLSGFAPREVQA